MMVGVLLSGSSAVAFLNEGVNSNLMTMGIMFLAAIIGAVSVVWNPTNRARNHEILARRFYETAKRIDVYGADPERLKQWIDEVLGVYEDEPEVFHALNAECYNAATQALGHGSKVFQQVTWRRHLLRHWIRFSAKDFPAGEQP